MKGHTHALSGLAAGLGYVCVTCAHGNSIWQAGLVATMVGGAAMLPDIDHREGTMAVMFGPVTEILTWAASAIARGHRMLTHCLIGVGLFTRLAQLLVWLAGPPGGPVAPELPLIAFVALLLGALLFAMKIADFERKNLFGVTNLAISLGLAWAIVHFVDLRFLPAAVALGASVHIAGDMCTVGGCPLLYPLSKRPMWILPRHLRWEVSDREGFIAERHLVAPLLIVLILLFGARLVWMAGLLQAIPTAQ